MKKLIIVFLSVFPFMLMADIGFVQSADTCNGAAIFQSEWLFNNEETPDKKSILVEKKQDGSCLVQSQYPNGHPEISLLFKEGEQTGLMLWWHENGTKRMEAPFAKGKYNGIVNVWNSAGILSSKMEYIDDQLDGEFITWYDNGQKQTEMHYKNNKMVGLASSWYPNGVLRYTGMMNNEGYPEGKWQTFYEDGRKKDEQFYDDKGRLIGKTIFAPD